ncbi:hypothetical protein ACFQRB_19760 [Halobaculum litoreum]|uniref:DUF1102 domain-containing protein n=1 Tax=Halobaculum litoreum TaxID=3031998 RepID=A0ABD5XX56_9EURY
MHRRRIAALVAVVLLALGGATATGAFTTNAAPSADLEAAPGTGPNGAYATVGDDGAIAVDLGERVNRDGVTRFAGVFTLTYTGEESASVWVSDGSRPVTFTALADSIEGPTNAVTLQPGDTLSVGVAVDTTDAAKLAVNGVTLHARLAGDTGAGSVTVRQPAPGRITVDVGDVSAGSPVTIDTTGANDGGNASVDTLSVTTGVDTDLSLSVAANRDNGSAPAFTGPQPGNSGGTRTPATTPPSATSTSRTSCPTRTSTAPPSPSR